MDQLIVEQLRLEVERTRIAYDKAKLEFWHKAAGAPGGAPQSDENQRMQNAAQLQMHATIEYTTALRRFNEYLLTGKISDDLKLEQQK